MHVLLSLFNDTIDYLLYWHTQKKRLISRKMKSYEGLCEKNVSALITTGQQLSKLHFYVDFLILNWGGQLT